MDAQCFVEISHYSWLRNGQRLGFRVVVMKVGLVEIIAAPRGSKNCEARLLEAYRSITTYFFLSRGPRVRPWRCVSGRGRDAVFCVKAG